MLNGNSTLQLKLSIVCAVLLLFASAVFASPHVMLVQPKNTASLFHGANADSMSKKWIGIWERMLTENQIRYDVFDESHLTQKFTDFNVIILPGTICLSDNQIKRIKEFVNQGGGLLATWAPGSRSEEGEWRGYSFIEEMIGGTVTESSRNVGEGASIYFRSNTPGNLRVPPGYRMRFYVNHKPLFVTPKGKLSIGGYLEDIVYNDQDPTGSTREPIYITKEIGNKGRFAWIGTNLDELQLDPVTQEYAKYFVNDLVNWLSGGAQISIAPWHEGKKAAVLLHGDIEDKFNLVTNILEIFRRNKLTGSLNILTNDASLHPNVMQQIKDSGFEISVHGDNHDIFKDQPYEVQKARLERTITFIENYGPRPVGFRPPELAHDSTTIAVIKELDFKFILADKMPDRDYPRFQWVNRLQPELGGTWMLPKSELDDYDLFERHKFKDRSYIENVLKTDFERIIDVGGLYKFAYHSQYLGDQNFLQAINSLVKLINEHKNDVWIAQSRDIFAYTERNRRLILTVNESNNTSMNISLYNDNPEVVENVVLRALPPSGVSIDFFSPLVTSRTCIYDIKEGMLYVYISRLNPGEDFTATFAKRSGLPLNDRTRKMLSSTQNIIIIIGLLFMSATMYYFLFTKKRKVAKLPDEDGFNDLKNLNMVDDSESIDPSILKRYAQQSTPPPAPNVAVDFIKVKRVGTSTLNKVKDKEPLKSESEKESNGNATVVNSIAKSVDTQQTPVKQNLSSNISKVMIAKELAKARNVNVAVQVEAHRPMLVPSNHRALEAVKAKNSLTRDALYDNLAKQDAKRIVESISKRDSEKHSENHKEEFHNDMDSLFERTNGNHSEYDIIESNLPNELPQDDTNFKVPDNNRLRVTAPLPKKISNDDLEEFDDIAPKGLKFKSRSTINKPTQNKASEESSSSDWL